MPDIASYSQALIQLAKALDCELAVPEDPLYPSAIKVLNHLVARAKNSGATRLTAMEKTTWDFIERANDAREILFPLRK